MWKIFKYKSKELGLFKEDLKKEFVPKGIFAKRETYLY